VKQNICVNWHGHPGEGRDPLKPAERQKSTNTYKNQTHNPKPTHLQKYNTNQMQKLPCVYILTNRPNGTLYVGVTSDLPKRVMLHRSDVLKGFTYKYQLKMLVYYEVHEDMLEAIHREKCIKEWRRRWKVRLIERVNPEWGDLYSEICG
jgi:putative endonuclease